jgi:preprotein translocase subunit YajC
MGFSMLKKFLLLAATASPFALFAQNGGGAAPREQNFVQLIIMFAIAIVFFYFILWRPERKRRKALETQRSSMKKGDKITAMGLMGTIDSISDKTVVIKTIDGSKIEILKGAITDVQSSTTVETSQT